MNRDQIQVWKHSEVTQKIIEVINDRIKSLQSPQVIFTDINQTALRNAHASGEIDGLSLIGYIIDQMEGEQKDD